MDPRKTNPFHLLIVRAPKKAVQQFIVLFYIIVQFILPCTFFSNLPLFWLMFFLALPMTVALVFVLRNIRLASQQAEKKGGTPTVPSILARQEPGHTSSGQVTKATLDALTWQEFELFVAEVYRRGGYRAEQKGGRNPDGGIDLILHSNEGKMLVQCKHWKAYKVGVKPVRELFGVMVSEGAIGAILVTGGEFTQEAQSWAVGKPLLLVNGSAFIAQANQAQVGQPLSLLEAIQKSHQETAPACPVCARVMRKRIAGSGPNVGREFWGCPAFPQCRGTRQIMPSLEKDQLNA